MIARAIAGNVPAYAFLIKMLLTALTLAAGYKGGEIVPAFFTGATFGCLFGHIFGISPSLCAATGMLALFCGVTKITPKSKNHTLYLNCHLHQLYAFRLSWFVQRTDYCLL